MKNSTQNLEAFQQFIPHKKQLPKIVGDGIGYGVIYTRVSSKEQFEKNGSIETQLKMCLKFAEQNSIPVLQQFGGSYESAKSEERKEFKKMMEFVKTSKQLVKFIIVSDNDRFSRTGANAISIAENLRKQGIQIKAVSSPIDTLSPTGEFQQNIQLLFSQYDNNIRRDKCSRGMKQKYEKGIFFGAYPIGYEKTLVHGEVYYKANAIGLAIKKAFKWKAELQISNHEISKKLEKLGYSISAKRLSVIFKNIFYCGLLTNKMLGENIIEGKNWDAIISKEIFIKANQVLSATRCNYDTHREDESIPLKRTVFCDKCGELMTGYIAKARQIYYYKCNTKSCCSNRNAEVMNDEFANYLKRFEINPKFIEPLKAQIKLALKTVIASNENKKEDFLKRKKELQNKIENLEERFITGEIDKGLFEKFKAKFSKEMSTILQETEMSKTNLSNNENLINQAVEISRNISKIWASGNLWEKQRLQKLVFPSKIYYNTAKSIYRTTNVNLIIAENARVAKVLELSKIKNPSQNVKDSHVVVLLVHICCVYELVCPAA